MSALRRTCIAAGVAALLPVAAQAAPSGGTVTAGSATIGSQGSQTVITQTTNSAIINWSSFSVGANESVKFVQPSTSAATLNRVTGSSPSNILGSISANGRVFLVNANGIVFGQSAQVNVGSLIATTLDIADGDFSAGKYAFKQGSHAPAGISNAGHLVATNNNTQGGNIVLLADHVSNTGYIKAYYGTVALHAGSALTLSFDSDGLINYEVDGLDSGQGAASSNSAGVSNSGSLYADGGTVYMTAAVARSAIATVVNNSGLISAQTMQDGAQGVIVLAAGGGDAEIGGQISGSNVVAVASRDVRKISGAALNLDAGALSVSAGRNIDLDSDDAQLSNAHLNVGSGYAIGIDTAMITQLQQKFPDLAPRSLAPNAGFEAGGSVAIGNLYIDGGYLYVRATEVSAQAIDTDGSLFYNYRPTSNTAVTNVATSLAVPTTASSVTLAFGGSGYDGAINVSNVASTRALPTVASGSANPNYVFMTNGKVSGADGIPTSGVVAILDGVPSSDPTDPGEPPPEELVELAAEIASVTSDLHDTLVVPDLQVTPSSGEPLISDASPDAQCQ